MYGYCRKGCETTIRGKLTSTDIDVALAHMTGSYGAAAMAMGTSRSSAPSAVTTSLVGS